MADLKNIFKTQGGMQLIKRYARGGALFTAIGEFVLLGKSRTALEILRLSADLKIKQKLHRKYKKVLEAFDQEYDENLNHENSKKVWVCWFQGMEKAPEIVKKCYASLQENLTDREIILITSDNMQDYVDFPDFILKKWEKGIITNTHMTDLLRLELLIRYGGTWIDSTVLCTRERGEIPDCFFDSNLFFYQTLKPGRDGHASVFSSWYLTSCSNNKILLAVRCLCYAYWQKNDQMVDYFLLHLFMSIVLEYYEESWKSIPPACNSAPHMLLLRLFEPYNEEVYNFILGQTPFHKLSYKFTEEQFNRKGTYYDRIFK